MRRARAGADEARERVRGFSLDGFECQAEKCGLCSVDNWKLGKDLPRSLRGLRGLLQQKCEGCVSRETGAERNRI